MSTPCISVVIPCYNAAAYVEEALASIRAQIGVNVHEVILVDDGSTDDSAERIARADNTVIVLSQRNSGISAARNAGIVAATSEWLAFLDADDVWPENSLQSRATLLAQRPDVGGVSGLIEQFISPDVSDERRAQILLPTAAMTGRLIGALLVRREVFERAGVFSSEFAVGETMDWLARVEAAGVRIGSVADVVLRRRVHNNNSVQKREQLKSDYLTILRASIARRRTAADAAELRASTT